MQERVRVGLVPELPERDVLPVVVRVREQRARLGRHPRLGRRVARARSRAEREDHLEVEGAREREHAVPLRRGHDVLEGCGRRGVRRGAEVVVDLIRRAAADAEVGRRQRLREQAERRPREVVRRHGRFAAAPFGVAALRPPTAAHELGGVDRDRQVARADRRDRHVPGERDVDGARGGGAAACSLDEQPIVTATRTYASCRATARVHASAPRGIERDRPALPADRECPARGEVAPRHARGGDDAPARSASAGVGRVGIEGVRGTAPFAAQCVHGRQGALAACRRGGPLVTSRRPLPWTLDGARRARHALRAAPVLARSPPSRHLAAIRPP